MEPGGELFINSSFIRFLGNMNSGGKKKPAAFMQISTVTSCPISADDSDPTCFLPRVATYLKDDARAADVGSGVRNEIASLWRVIN